MQNNIITVGEDAYERFQEMPDKSTYVGPGHKPSSVNLLLLGRSVAISDDANAKSRASFVRDLSNVDEPTVPKRGKVYFNIDASYPQWAADTDLQDVKDAVIAFLSSTEFNDLFTKQSI